MMNLSFFSDAEPEYRGRLLSTEICEWFKTSQLPFTGTQKYQILLLGMILNQFHPCNHSH